MKIRRYKPLIIYIGFIIGGLVIWYFFEKEKVFPPEKELWDFWSAIDTSSAVALAVLAFLAYKDMIKQEDIIPLYFNVNGKEIDTKLSLLRKNCTRGEVVGVLGMMQKNTKNRFSFSTKALPLFLEQLQEVQKGKRNKIVISMTQEEFEQFEILE